MDILKTILKCIVGLLIGGVIGFGLAAVMIVLFTDVTFAEFIGKFVHADYDIILKAAAVGVAALLVSVFVLVILHELGHLVCGVLTGYRFVSFRIFNYTLIRRDGRFCIRRFAVAGTGGQCLLSPPDLPVDMIPTGWYNMGGIIANIIALSVAILLLVMADLNPYVHEALWIFVLTDAFLILTNGIPMSVDGFGNDAHNALMLGRNLAAKRALMLQLRTNALIQEGMRPRDMPGEWFEIPEQICHANSLEVSMPLMTASRLVDMERWEEAYAILAGLHAHKSELMGIYAREVACELAFTAMMTGRTDEARSLLEDGGLMKYVNTYRKFMSSKERLLCAARLYLHDDPDGALDIYLHLRDRSCEYLLQGEVASDLALMAGMLAPVTDGCRISGCQAQSSLQA